MAHRRSIDGTTIDRKPAESMGDKVPALPSPSNGQYGLVKETRGHPWGKTYGKGAPFAPIRLPPVLGE